MKKLCFISLFLLAISVLSGQNNDNARIYFQTGNQGDVSKVAFLPDGKFAISAAQGSTMRLWELDTGREIATYDTIRASYTFALSPDGKMLACATDNSHLSIRDVMTGTEIVDLGYCYSNVVDFSPQGTQLAAFQPHSGKGYDETLTIYNSRTWQKTKSILVSNVNAQDERITQRTVNFTPDGKHILMRGKLPNETQVILINIATGDIVYTIEGLLQHTDIYVPSQSDIFAVENKNGIFFYDILTGEMVKHLTTTRFWNITFSNDGTKLFGRTLFQDKIQIFDVNSGDLIKSLSIRDQGYTRGIAVDQKNELILIGGTEGKFAVYDIEREQISLNLTSQIKKLYESHYLNDKQSLLYGTVRSVLKARIDSGSTILEYPLPEHQRLVKYAVSDDGAFLATYSRKNMFTVILLWDVQNGTVLNEWDIPDGSNPGYQNYHPFGDTISFSSNAKYIVLTNGQTCTVIDTNSGEIVFNVVKEGRSQLSEAEMAPNNRYLATTTNGTEVHDITSGNIIFSSNEGSEIPVKLFFSSDSHILYRLGRNGELTRFNIGTGTATVLNQYSNYLFKTFGGTVSPDGKYLYVGDLQTRGIKKIELATGRILYSSVKGHSTAIINVDISPDGSIIISCSNNSISFWDASTGEQLATSIIVKSGRFLSWTPNGFFSGDTNEIKNMVYLVKDMSSIAIEQFYNLFYRPDIVYAHMTANILPEFEKNIDIATLLQDDSLPPSVQIISPEIISESVERDIRVKIRVYDRGSGIGAIQILNGSNPVIISRASSRGLIPLQRNNSTEHNYPFIDFETLLTLRHGVNELHISAFDESNAIESRREQLHIAYNKEKALVKPQLHIATVAVQQYRDRALQLNYTLNDANTVLSSFKGQNTGLYGDINSYSLHEDSVTKSGFSDFFSKLSTSITSDDVFILYFAGHGITNSDDGEYYFLPHNFRYNGSRSISDQGISKSDILDSLLKIQAQKVILLFDTCNSGSFVSGPSSRGIAEKTAIDRLIRGVGRAVIMASSDDQVALEGIDNHGVFTYSLLEGLGGSADINKDAYVTIKELSTWIELSVPDITYDKWGYEQVPQSHMPTQDFPLFNISQ